MVSSYELIAIWNFKFVDMTDVQDDNCQVRKFILLNDNFSIKFDVPTSFIALN